MTIGSANLAEFAQRDAFYRLLVQNFPKLALIVFDRDMRYVMADGAYLQAEGYTSETMIGKTLREVVPPARYAVLSTYYQAALEGKEVEFEGAGNQSFYRSRISPVRDDQGEIIAGMIVTEDITTQKRAEQSLRDSESRYRFLVDNKSDLVIQTSRDGEYIFVSSSAQRIVGYTPAELFGKSLADFIHPDDAQNSAMHRLLDLPDSPASDLITLRFRHKQGHYIWLEQAGLPIYLEPTNQLIGFVLTYRDVTARHVAEESTNDIEERLRLLVETSADGIVLGEKTRTGLILLANPAACRMFGRTREEMLTCSATDLIDTNDPRFIAFSEERKHSAVGRAELAGVRKDGTTFPIDITVSDFTNRDGKVLVWRIIRDMSDRQRYLQLRIEQEKLLTAIQKEGEFNQLKSHMMERVTHEFRTPLTTLDIALTLLTVYVDRLSNEHKQKKTELAHRQISRLTNMLDEIGLAISGKLVPRNLEITPFDLKTLCLQVALELEEQLVRPDTFAFDLSAPITINGDYTVLKTALHHVMRNALRFSTPTAKVKVKLFARAKSAELQIIDNGVGILPEDHARIFEPFYRGRNIGVVGGLGLGLTIAQASIAAHNGTIQLTSNAGQGTTVTIRLPFAADQVPT